MFFPFYFLLHFDDDDDDDAGAQFGTVVSMPLSGLLSEYGFDGGWPSIFYVFGIVGVVWSLAFIFSVHEDPEAHPSIAEDEKKYILSSVWGAAGVSVSSYNTIFQKLSSIFINHKFLSLSFDFSVTAGSLDVDTDLVTILGYPHRSHRSELRLRNAHDRTPDFYEAGSSF